MPPLVPPDLSPVRDLLARLAPQDATNHLEAARQSLEDLNTRLRAAPPLSAEEKRRLERSLLRLQADLRAASALARQGLALCNDWADQLQPNPATYQPNGAPAAMRPRHELSLEA